MTLALLLAWFVVACIVGLLVGRIIARGECEFTPPVQARGESAR